MCLNVLIVMFLLLTNI